MKTNFRKLFMKLGKTKFIGLLILVLHANVGKAQLSFTESEQNLGSVGYACAIGDLNNDGYPDIYIVNCDKPDEVWFNNGKGVFIKSGQKIGNTIKYNKNVGLADLDCDGDLDIFIANDADWGNKNPTVGLPNEVWLNDGNGKFTDSGQRLGNLASVDVALGDVNGDGYIDAVVANLHNTDLGNLTYQPNEVWLNDGKGNFRNSGQSLGVGSLHVKLVDIDGDGDLDAVFQHPRGDGFVIWINDGKGKFTKSNNTLGGGSNIAFGDLNGDGYQDAFIVKGGPNGSAPCEVWLNDGSGKFTDSGQRLGNLVGYDVALGDIDGDGDLDALVTNGMRTAQAPILWINQGGKQGGTPGTFKESEIVFSDSQIGKVKLVDLDKDGDLDIVITNYAGANKIYFNNTSTNNYLGLTPPGNTPIIFAPGTISTVGNNEHTLSVSPDGNEIYFTADSPGDGLTIIKRVYGKWTEPQTANLRGNHSWEFEAFFANEGKNLYFTSDTNNLSKFWCMEKGKNGWSKARYLDSPINNFPGMWCTFTRDETMYYGNNNNFQINRARLVNGKYTDIEDLGFRGVHPSVAPDESYFIFNSNQYSGFGKNDIFIVFRKEDGNWTNPVNMGNKINTSYGETCASLSPDDKYIFFSRYDEPGEKSNIYWSRVDILIDSLKRLNHINN